MILILSFNRDLSVSAVEQFLKKWEVQYFKYSFTHFPEQSSLSLEIKKQTRRILLQAEGRRYDLNAVTAVWNRRCSAPVISKQRSAAIKKYIESESSQFINTLALHTAPESYWVSPIHNVVSASNKFYQLQVASRLGLTVPHTVMGNDSVAIREMLEQYPLFALKTYYRNQLELDLGPIETVKKFLYNFLNRKYIQKKLIPEYQSIFYFRTQCLDRAEVERALPSFEHCPVIFQEYIAKKLELRITVVGSQVFACALYSQECPSLEGRIDFRSNIHDIRHEPYQLPEEIERKCVLLVKELGLQFGCIDMIITPAGEYVFLEINPNGQWLWIQDRTKMPIAKAIAELLVTREGL